MVENFIKRNLFIKLEGKTYDTTINISIPKSSKEGYYECHITFSNVEKYNTTSKGIDEFNAIECALEYVDSVCRNSDSPEFLISRSETMRGAYRPE